ncbi:MAG: DNA polymerase/3'-5' exonuclease PolX [Candidatus Thermoplasmatota archaeon]|nr:DNA polymerase/3'-5' exonuclease PolX [Candidatus Thermoplasmatota archaeon]
MDTDKVVRLLNNIADLMDINGEQFFKTRAYRMAAETLREIEEPIDVLVKEQRLQDLPGIGKAIAKKISTFVTTGSLPYYEELKKEVPPSLLDLLDIQGLGPKKVAVLYKKLGITTIDELQKAARQHKLQDLDGFGVTTENNILRGIALQSKTSGRSLLHHALQQGNQYVEYLKKISAIKNISIAGSLRRRKETIGDIDILVSSSDPDRIMDAFSEYHLVDEVMLKGKTKTSVRLNDGIQVDLRVVEKKSFGSALQYFTGSKEHNVLLRSLALKNDMKLNEYGVFSKGTDEYLAGKTEQEVYETIGLPFIPPELRENRGEIDAAYNNSLPHLLQLEDIKGDLHVHSTYSDGINSIEEIVKACEKINYEYIGITDHSQSLKVANGVSVEDVQKKCDHIKKINKNSNITVLCGTECDILKDGSLDYSDETLKKFDYVGIGIHSLFKMNKKEATHRIITALDNPFVTFLAHPTCRMIGHREGFELDMELLFDKAVETNTFLEINAFPDRLDLNDINVKRAKDKGVHFIIGSDSHSIQHLPNMQYGVATARRGWLEKQQVLNTTSVSKLKQILNG